MPGATAGTESSLRKRRRRRADADVGGPLPALHSPRTVGVTWGATSVGRGPCTSAGPLIAVLHAERTRNPAWCLRHGSASSTKPAKDVASPMEKKSEFRIDDEMARQIEVYKEDLEPFVGKESLNAAIAAVPFVGSVILSIANDVGTRKSYERAIEMFRLIKQNLERLHETKLDRAFFTTDEFQTLLFLAFEQLRTTHDTEKRAMLAAALSNSGTTEFSTEERKELFVRILRDLSPQHIRVLKGLVPAERFKDAGPTFWPKESNPEGESLGLLQYLSAMGLG
jgi:hypothetical protein